MNYRDFTLGDWIGHISGVIEDETTLDGNEMRDLVEFLTTMQEPKTNNITIPKEAANGDVLCMLFPNMHYTLSDKSQRVVTTIGVASSFDLDWWNAPYQSEVNE